MMKLLQKLFGGSRRPGQDGNRPRTAADDGALYHALRRAFEDAIRNETNRRDGCYLWDASEKLARAAWARVEEFRAQEQARGVIAHASGVEPTAEEAEFKDCGCAPGTCERGPEGCPYPFGVGGQKR